MSSWTERKSRKQFRREGQPLAPNADVAGKNVNAFRRFLHAQDPPIKQLSAKHLRREGISEDIVVIPYQWLIRRFVPAQFPPIEIFRGRSNRRNAKPPEWAKYDSQAGAYYRVADTTIELYELYIGEDGAEPDFTAAPDDTSASLPFSYALTPPGAGTKEYKATVRFRNRYNIISLNQYSRSFIIDDAGNLVTPDPSAPQDVALSDTTGLKVKVYANYYPDDDGDNSADKWRIWATDTGVDPDPADPVTAEIAMKLIMPRENLIYNLGPYAKGADVRVLIRTYRSGDTTDDGNTTVYQHTVTSGPSDPSKINFFGGEQNEYR